MVTAHSNLPAHRRTYSGVPVTEFGCAGASGAGIPSRGDSGHDAQHYAMLQRNLLYTGVTRGKRLVVLVGQKKAVAIAVRNVSGRPR